MDEIQRKRAIALIAHIQNDLDRRVQYFGRSGQLLSSVSAIIEAWARGGGLVAKEPENRQAIEQWIGEGKGRTAIRPDTDNS
jgi:hypothetical protein